MEPLSSYTKNSTLRFIWSNPFSIEIKTNVRVFIMKKHFLLCGLLMGFICSVLSMPCIQAYGDVRLDDGLMDEEEEMLLGGKELDPISFDKTRAVVPIESILQLIEDVGGFALLEQDFYLLTNPFVQRSLLDLPLWELHSCQEPEKWIVGAHLFWNQMDRSVFTCKSTNISSFLDLTQQTLFNALDNIRQNIENEFPVASLIDPLSDTANFDKILRLFRGYTVQQRRLGAMFHVWRQWQRAELRMLLPLYYIERNYNATPEENRAIEEQFGAFDPDEFKLFSKNHGISDKVGFGDFRFEANYAAYQTDTFAFRAGGFLTIPTAFAISKGIKGSSFRDDLCQPTLDLQAIFDLIFKDGDLTNPTISPDEQEALKEVLIGDICKNKNGFLLGTLDRMSAILLDTPLGNGGHVGLGLMLRSKTSLRALLDEYEWTDNISWNNRLSVEYLTPSNETRFYIRRNEPSDFTSRDFDSDDEQIQKDNLIFLQKEIVDKFYPYAIKTKVQPGVIFHWFSRFCFTGEVWDISLGSDFWLQQGESLKNLQCVDKALLERLDICNAIKPMAYQFKTVGSLSWKVLRPDYAFFFSLNAEGTSWNKGIGDDWTVSLNIEANF